MSNKQSKHPANINSEQKNTNNNHNKIIIRNVIGGAVIALSSIPFGYGFIYLGAILVLIGIGICAYGYIRHCFLFPLLIIIFLITTFMQYLKLAKNKTITTSTKQKQSTDSTLQAKKIDSLLIVNKKTSKTQERLTIIETRAYISLKYIDPFIIKTFKRQQFNLNFYNSGSTPANDVRLKIFFKIGTGVYQSDLDTLNKSNIITYGGVIGAKQLQRFTYNDSIVITKNDSIDVFNNIKFIYSFGKVYYRDAFKDSHTMCFCAKFQPPENWEYIYEDPDCIDETKIKNHK